MDRKRLRAIAASAAIVAIFFGFYAGSHAEAKSLNTSHVRVLRVHDGDTISVISGRKKEKVRLIGIDAPEIKQRPWGTRAKKHLEKLLMASDRKVSLEFDVEKRDKYGRLLCYIFISDGKMLNLEMLRYGYAMLLTIPPNIKYVDELKKAQNEAKEHKRGIWGKKGLMESPQDYRKKHPYR